MVPPRGGRRRGGRHRRRRPRDRARVMTTLAAQHDCLLVDLDGTLFRGAEPTVGARETLDKIDAAVFFVTNNASRSAAEVAGHLRELGFTAEPHDVVTSAQTAARLLASQLDPDARVLVVG